MHTEIDDATKPLLQEKFLPHQIDLFEELLASTKDCKP